MRFPVVVVVYEEFQSESVLMDIYSVLKVSERLPKSSVISLNLSIVFWCVGRVFDMFDAEALKKLRKSWSEFHSTISTNGSNAKREYSNTLVDELHT
jgi:uncharacterized membrane protein